MRNTCKREKISNRAHRFSIDYYSMPEKVKEMFKEEMLKAAEDDNPCMMFLLLERMKPLSECESPIEKILLNALMRYSDELWIGFEYKPQQVIKANGKRYIADILFDMDFYCLDKPYRLVIECDGHDYHEITKEQVERRNVRDMDLKMAGYDVLHYSGSQIFRNPKKCAKEITEYIMVKVRERAYG